MRSKSVTWLLLVISIALLPISSYLFDLVLPVRFGYELNTFNIMMLLAHEWLWIIIILAFNHWVIKQRLSFKFSRFDFKVPFIFIVLLILLALFSEVLSNQVHHSILVDLLIAILVGSVGLLEETLFRGIIFPQVLGTLKNLTNRSVYIAVVVSSLMFGGLHGFNLLHQSIPTTLVQIIFAIGIGCFLCAMYIRSESLLVPMLIHGLWDFNSAFVTSSISEEAVKSFIQAGLQSLLILAIFSSIAFTILRPSMLKPHQKWLKQITGH